MFDNIRDLKKRIKLPLSLCLALKGEGEGQGRGGIRARSMGLTNRFNYNNVPFLHPGVKYFRYLSTNMPNKDFNNLLTIPFDQRFGQYQDYLSKKKKN